MALTRWMFLMSLLSPAGAAAQSEAALKSYFEGRAVTLQLAMPGTEAGVDISPADPKPLDYSGTPSGSRRTARRSVRASRRW